MAWRLAWIADADAAQFDLFFFSRWWYFWSPLVLLRVLSCSSFL
jgi:hypothetical protein